MNVFGPTSTWILRRMVTGLDEYPGGYELDLEQTAGALGLVFTPEQPVRTLRQPHHHVRRDPTGAGRARYVDASHP